MKPGSHTAARLADRMIVSKLVHKCRLVGGTAKIDCYSAECSLDVPDSEAVRTYFVAEDRF